MSHKESFSWVSRNLAVVIAIVVQTVGIVWWASAIDSKVENTRVEVAELKRKIESGDSVYITRQALNDILGANNEKLNQLEKKIDQLTALINLKY